LAFVEAGVTEWEKVDRRDATRKGKRRRMRRFVERRKVGVQGRWRRVSGMRDKMYL
jgi:hypothetical protein